MSSTDWTRHDLNELKKLFAKATTDRVEQFKFQGSDVLVEHVKVLIPQIEKGLKK